MSKRISKLTPQTYWDGIHVGEQQAFSAAAGNTQPGACGPLIKKIIRAIKKYCGNTVLERISAYDDYLLFDVILAKFLPPLNGANCLEIGSAPGDYSVQFSKHHGCTPYGVEYSPVGVQVNREVFGQNGFNPDNVIYADFFSNDFVANHKEKFDVVMSKGFIEHFDDAKSVVDRHMDLLKPGGHLIVIIPNLRGVNYLLASLFDEGAIPRHNIKIMRKGVYGRLFDREDLVPLFCEYYGTFSFYLFTAGPSGVRRRLLRLSHRFQPVLNLTMRTILGRRGAETGSFSPFLLYIGRKSGRNT